MSIATRLDLPRREGQVGIEVEVEAPNGVGNLSLNYWETKGDDSLTNGIEFVLRNPMSRQDVETAITELRDGLRGRGVQHTIRAGVHIHLNAQKMTFESVAVMAAIYWMYEDALLKLCGESREGNMYCLRLGDAEGLLDDFRLMVANKLPGANNSRYGAIRFCSLFTHGSVEFRAMKSTTALAPLKKWIYLLSRIQEVAIELGSTTALFQEFDRVGAEAFTQRVFSAPKASAFLRQPDVYRRAEEVAVILQSAASARGRVPSHREGLAEVPPPQYGFSITRTIGPAAVPELREDSEQDVGPAPTPAPRNQPRGQWGGFDPLGLSIEVLRAHAAPFFPIALEDYREKGTSWIEAYLENRRYFQLGGTELRIPLGTPAAIRALTNPVSNMEQTRINEFLESRGYRNAA